MGCNWVRFSSGSPANREDCPCRARPGGPAFTRRAGGVLPWRWPSLWVLVGSVLAGGVVSFRAGAASPLPIRLMHLEETVRDGWRSNRAAGLVIQTPVIQPGFPWDQLVVSWNVVSNAVLTVEAQLPGTAAAPRWYALGRWSGDTNQAPRTSVRQDPDAVAEVDTDILRLKQPADSGVILRLTLDGTNASAGSLRLLAACFVDGRAPWPGLAARREAWGRGLEVPVFSQADYPEGVQSWCSPTSGTMLLGWWAERLGRPDLRVDVRDVVRGVHDPAWPGTGNWPFNTAYLGQSDGLRACVARLAGIPDLEGWILHGCPVACSVSYALLKGGPAALPGDGHLVVVRGFTAEGDVLVNDPGVRRDRVRRVVPRADFDRAWARSRRTAYLVWSEAGGMPPGGEGRW